MKFLTTLILLFIFFNCNCQTLFDINQGLVNNEECNGCRPNSAKPNSFFIFNNSLYFTAETKETGHELWKFGTSRAILVKDIYFDADTLQSGNPSLFTKLGNEYYFAANDGMGRELWKTDGTGVGTNRIADIYPGQPGSNPSYLTNIGNHSIYFAANSSSGIELWRTSSGITQMIKDINPAPGKSSMPKNIIEYKGSIYFTADDGIYGRELYRTKGSATSTYLVRDINPTGASDPDNLTLADNCLYFSAYRPETGRELYRMDSVGNILLIDINKGSGNSSPKHLLNVNNILYFSANIFLNTVNYGRELCSHVGNTTSFGYKDLWPGSFGSNPADFTLVGSTIYFAADTIGKGRELFMRNIVTKVTKSVADLEPGQASSNPKNFLSVQNNLYFTAYKSISGREMYKTIGTASGTIQVTDIVPGAGSSTPENLTNLNGSIYFSAQNNNAGRELWRLSIPANRAASELGVEVLTDEISTPNYRLVPQTEGSYGLQGYSQTEEEISIQIYTIDGKLVNTIPNIKIYENFYIGLNIPKINQIYLIQITQKSKNFILKAPAFYN